jgi:hypothetical protein
LCGVYVALQSPCYFIALVQFVGCSFTCGLCVGELRRQRVRKMELHLIKRPLRGAFIHPVEVPQVDLGLFGAGSRA